MTDIKRRSYTTDSHDDQLLQLMRNIDSLSKYAQDPVGNFLREVEDRSMYHTYLMVPIYASARYKVKKFSSDITGINRLTMVMKRNVLYVFYPMNF